MSDACPNAGIVRRACGNCWPITPAGSPPEGSLWPSIHLAILNEDMKMTQKETKRLVPSYWELPVDAQHATARFLVGAKLGEIVEANAHGVTEIEIGYFRHGKAHQLVWDATTRKILGGSEKMVIEEVLKHLPDSGLKAVQQGGEAIHHLKIKHDDHDDHEYMHVHFVDAKGNLTGVKLELDGAAKRSAR